MLEANEKCFGRWESDFKAEREIKQALRRQMDQRKITTKPNEMNREWIFNPSSSPWMGGAIEVLVKTTKLISQSHIVTEEKLHTHLPNIESIVNSILLTSISNDANDKVTLPPNHFLVGWTLPNQNFVLTPGNHWNLCAKRKAAQALTKHYMGK